MRQSHTVFQRKASTCSSSTPFAPPCLPTDVTAERIPFAKWPSNCSRKSRQNRTTSPDIGTVQASQRNMRPTARLCYISRQSIATQKIVCDAVSVPYTCKNAKDRMLPAICQRLEWRHTGGHTDASISKQPLLRLFYETFSSFSKLDI